MYVDKKEGSPEQKLLICKVSTLRYKKKLEKLFQLLLVEKQELTSLIGTENKLLTFDFNEKMLRYTMYFKKYTEMVFLISPIKQNLDLKHEEKYSEELLSLSLFEWRHESSLLLLFELFELE
jgi:CO dehydrogenase/acetyl-CoA synthase gamma subunit (corrinoid Fe-S protein)